MSRLAELIEELCPDGVEYRPLGAIADLQRGAGMPKKLFVDKGIPAIHYGHIFTKYGIQTKCAAAYLAPEDADKLTRVYPGDLVVANTSENLEDVGKGVVWFGDVEGVTGGHATVVRSLVVDTVFLSYYLRTEDFALKKRKYAQGTKVIELSAVNLSKIDIPVPPLEVQREIVRILNKFTTLEARRAQYEYYRNHLLSYESLACRGPVTWKSLGDVTELKRGSGMPKALFTDSGVPAIHYGHIYTKYGIHTMHPAAYVAASEANKLVKVHPGDLVIANTSENLDDVGRAVVWLGDEDAVTGGHATVVRPSALDPVFLAHYLRTDDFGLKKRKIAQGTKVIEMSAVNLAKILIPVPSREEQRRIADLLDRFDTLVNDISSGLPAEIEARRAQYEHYRDRLLSFPGKAVSGSDAS